MMSKQKVEPNTEQKTERHSDEELDLRTFLVFGLADESYAVPVERVEEVLEYEQPTFVPRSPEYLLGIINVRGRLVPILDLRCRFGLPDADHTGDSRFIIMDLHWGDDSISLGVLTDSVQGVIDLPPEVIGPPPTIGQGVESTFLRGTARYQDRILLLMEVDQILTPDFIHAGFAALSTRG